MGGTAASFSGGAVVDLTDCDREPIHIPGTIQPHGVLLVLAEPALTVAQVSDERRAFTFAGASTTSWASRCPPSLIRRRSTRCASRCVSQRWYETNPLRIQANGVRFDGILHRHDGAAILELEPNPGPPTPMPMYHPFRPA
jgi:light-regulated signal transduction histidine kinase (bacteriophytochrome)